MISKLYEILTSKNRPYSPQKNKSSELYERARKIQLDGQRIKKNEINKRIGEKNLQLLEAITTVKSSHNPVDLEKVSLPVTSKIDNVKDYIERKRIVERLRLNSSPTALHLLAAPPVLSKRPKSGECYPFPVLTLL